MYTLKWNDAGPDVFMIDQTLLPAKLHYITIKTYEKMAVAIEDMQVRGAPAIGVSAAMGVALGAVQFKGSDTASYMRHMEKVCKRLAATRPTAVNLFWAIKRMESVLGKNASKGIASSRKALIAEAKKIWKEDIDINKRIGENGAALLKKGTRILTHCNAGALATAAYGTALGVIRSAYKKGLIEHVYADETRPRLQGAMLTAFELVHEKIPATLICDNTAATLMAAGKIDCCVVGADRIAANGDTANKVGTYSLAIVAKHHSVPLYIAAPLSTIDTEIKSGSEIPIEHRSDKEVRLVGKTKICPDGIGIYNQAFDVTPASLIAGIITEKGVLKQPYNKSIKSAFGGK